MKYVILGASSGLGRELAYSLAEKNNNLVNVRNEKEKVEKEREAFAYKKEQAMKEIVSEKKGETPKSATPVDTSKIPTKPIGKF